MIVRVVSKLKGLVSECKPCSPPGWKTLPSIGTITRLGSLVLTDVQLSGNKNLPLCRIARRNSKLILRLPHCTSIKHHQHGEAVAPSGGMGFVDPLDSTQRHPARRVSLRLIFKQVSNLCYLPLRLVEIGLIRRQQCWLKQHVSMKIRTRYKHTN